ncbi:hypothetical protein [Chondromyces crocatus]|uniref:hypothetical protein n=1 Tax=Chondromyces crocatus TaxID=52 RepID=UPI0012E1D049|nr:hypothetical protein [Chondromyces crocatus]
MDYRTIEGSRQVANRPDPRDLLSILGPAGEEWTEETIAEWLDGLPVASLTPENLDDVETFSSPSGAYRLEVACYRGATHLAYSRGTVVRRGESAPVAVVDRNDAFFPQLFIEDHPEGPFLVCGADYQGQTVIHLPTGKRRDFLPRAAARGHGFCWMEYAYHAASETLIVMGCHWACPYEHRLYDFSHPMRGWPHIGADVWLDEDPRAPDIQGNRITVYQTVTPEDGARDGAREIASYQVFERRGLDLLPRKAWISEKAFERQRATTAAMETRKATIEAMRASPLFQLLVQETRERPFDPESGFYTGETSPGWCPFFEGREPLISKIVARGEPHIEIAWGLQEAPVKLTMSRGGGSSEELFERSEAGMRAAIEAARACLEEAAPRERHVPDG